MRLIELHPPEVSDHEARFSWHVTPASGLYRRTSFHLRFPDSVELAAVPVWLWWRIALICLHPHWPLLRPCRVQLPVALPDGEAEAWLRLTDAGVATLEAATEPSDGGRKIAIVGNGPLEAQPEAGRTRPAGAGGVVTCFSGGRDSLTQTSMLCELGLRPLLVTVTSPSSWSVEHETARRYAVFDEIVQRRRLELIEVQSDMRGIWDNDFAAPYRISVNELTDTLLYTAAAVVVAAARGAGLVLIASEAEVQENARRGGTVIQARHHMYSAVTHRALEALLAPAGIGVGSLTYPLRQFQVQRLLAERYPEVRDLQYSCWELQREQGACSRCPECRGIALNLMARGHSPALAGIDVVELLLAHEQWQPGGRYLPRTAAAGALPGATAGAAHEMQELRCLAATTPQQVSALLDGAHTPAERERAMNVYSQLRERALAQEIDPEPGYRAGYLELLPDQLRDGVRSILDAHFTPAPPADYEQMLANTRTLSGWITAPLRTTRQAQSPEHEPVWIAELIPDPEPPLAEPPEGRVVRVADTLLDGNELQYVAECVTGNWISSAGSFVPRLERTFADAVGARFAVVCSSGTAALHLAFAAAGIGPGDEVLMPAFTMIATANAARYVGAEPVLIDADPETWNLDPERLGDKLTRRTRAVVAVHTYGLPADMDAICSFARRNGLLVIEDAAEAHGAHYRGAPVGSIGDVAAFSFYGNKIVTSGEGGSVTTNNQRIAEVARELRDHAFSAERHFWHRRLGFNYRMTNLQAAVGLAQAERLEQLVERRRKNAQRYGEALAGIDGIELPPQADGSVNWMYGIRVSRRPGIGRDELRRRLAAHGVETRTFFVPLHLQPIYRVRFAGQRYPVAEQLGASGLYLPSGPALSDEDIAYVADAIRSAQARTPSSA